MNSHKVKLQVLINEAAAGEKMDKKGKAWSKKPLSSNEDRVHWILMLNWIHAFCQLYWWLVQILVGSTVYIGCILSFHNNVAMSSHYLIGTSWCVYKLLVTRTEKEKEKKERAKSNA